MTFIQHLSIQIPFSKVQVLIFVFLLLSTSSSAFVPRGGVGVLKMCPPGGESFATAWQLTCGMRKKRNVKIEQPDLKDLNPEIDQGSLLPMPTSDGIAVDKVPMEAEIRERRANAAGNGYRPLSMTEMMRFCCKYGCTFRDLLPYCDPFGQWDS
uniref:Insulin-like domain-containing protein n=1 Tax=Panagrolaimus sp. JU765 TaxID=591449 RepID=A0AC34PX59_9BILA